MKRKAIALLSVFALCLGMFCGSGLTAFADGNPERQYCWSCGSKIPENCVYCIYCGVKLDSDAGTDENDADGSSYNSDTEPHTEDKYKVGSYVKFGTYEQDNIRTNGPEEIEWLVLDNDGEKALLISRYALDCQRYNTKKMYMTWENCTLRTWLNERFYNAAFTKDQQSTIETASVTADKNTKFSTSPGSETKDKIFLLSIAEVNKYFQTDDERKCVPTEYAVANGAFANAETGKCMWWLRTPGCGPEYAAYVYDSGALSVSGYPVQNTYHAVRPAMWVSLT